MYRTPKGIRRSEALNAFLTLRDYCAETCCKEPECIFYRMCGGCAIEWLEEYAGKAENRHGRKFALNAEAAVREMHVQARRKTND